MPLRDLFVIGVHLGGDSGKKRSARFIHALADGSQTDTVCGCDVGSWSRRYLNRRRVTDLMIELVCMTCAHKVGLI